MRKLAKVLLYLAAAILLFFIVLFVTVAIVNRPGKQLAGMPSHHYERGFRSPFLTAHSHGASAFFRWQFDRMRGRVPEKPKHYSFEVFANDGRTLPTTVPGLTVTWIGHATALLQIENRNILTDPIFSERCSPVQFAGPKRFVQPQPSFEALPPIDAVIISHNHYDHLDEGTIRKLGDRPQYFVPLGVGKIVESFGVSSSRIIELDWWQESEIRGLKFYCTPTQHFSGRGLYDRDKTLWCSWVIAGKERRVYFGGDTGYFFDLVEIGERYGPFDLVLLPIGAYLPRWFMSPVHVDPAQAAQAFLDLNARFMLAIHWGTFDLADEALDQPPKDLAAAVDSLQIDRERVWVFKHGETRAVEKRDLQ